MRKPLLFLPGPMQIPDDIRAAADRPMYNHRSAQMDQFLAKLENGCRPLFGTSGDILFLASSGTGAMESAVVNMTSPGEEILVVVGGTFAQRWVEIGDAFGLKTHVVNSDWRNGVTVAEVAAALAQHPKVETVFMTWSESSTGVLNELEGIGKLVRSQEKFLVADAVSGLAVSPLAMDAACVDVVIAGSQKGLMLPAGLGVVAVGERGWKKVGRAQSPRFYWDWKRFKGTAPFTPALTLLFQLDAALDSIAHAGLEKHFARKAGVAGKIRDLVRTSSLELYAHRPGDGITAIVTPAGFDAGGFKRRLESDFGIQIAGGLGPLQNTTFRIGHVGSVTDEELDYFMRSFTVCLSQ